MRYPLARGLLKVVIDEEVVLGRAKPKLVFIGIRWPIKRVALSEEASLEQ